MEVKGGRYAITEQGDLGLGLTPITESDEELKTRKDDDDCNNELPMFYK